MSSAERARAEKVARWVFARVLLLVPAEVRARAGADLLADFVERQREASTGALLLRVWLSEFAGVLAMAVRSRLRDRWSASVDDKLRHTRGDRGASRRESRIAATLDHRRRDLRFAARSIARRPGPAALAAVTFALGIAASTSMYSVVDAVLLRPLPFPEPERLVSVYPTLPEWRTVPSLQDVWDRASFSYPEYTEWLAHQRSFESAAALGRRVVTLAGGGEPERVQMGSVSASLFPMLGVVPALGRTFAPDEDDRVDAVVLLSHGLWLRRFGGDTEIVGTVVRLSDVPYTVIGVLPESFRLIGFESDAWSPLGGPAAENMRDNHSLKVIGRLASGVTLEAAQVETARLLDEISPESHMTQHGARLVPRVADVTGEVRQPLLLLILAAGLLLAVSCASVAAVLLGVGIDREAELTVRAALGATRGRLASQLLTESIALAVVGGGLGVLLARLALDGLVLLAPPGIPRIDEVVLNGRIVALAIALSAICGLTFGMVPALALSGRKVAAGSRVTGGRARLQSAIVVAELALATLLLVSAGLLTRTMLALERVDPGFRTEDILTVRVAHSWPRFQHDSTGEVLTAYMDEIAGALGGVPGVRAVAMTSVLPYSGDRATNAVVVEGYTPAPGEIIDVERNFVSWNYLDVMDIPILRGRDFTLADDRRDAEHVVIVSERLAARFWRDVDPIGRTLGFWDTTFRVIGVAADVRDTDLSADAGLDYYVPRRPLGFGSGSFVLSVDGDPAASAPAVRTRIWSVDPELPITSILPLQERIAESVAGERYRMRLIVLFATLSAVFALLGVYGVTSRWVARRTPELGIRVALGAERGRVLALVLGHGVRLAVAGTLAGIGASLVATRLLASFLFGVRPNDVVTIGAIALLLFVMTLFATFGPARRAARIDPVTALRSD